jgi:DNA-binding transcriptional regulator YiaG
MTICLVSPPVLTRPMPSTAVLPAWSRDYTPYRWCDVQVITKRAGEPRRKRAIVPGVGALIKQARERRGVSQAALAGLLNVAQPTLASWEKETRSASLMDLLLVAKLLGVHVVELLPVPPPLPPVVFDIRGPYRCRECGRRGNPPVKGNAR